MTAHDDDKELAMQLQLDATLAEAMGLGPADDLASRIAARLQQPPRATPARTSSRWLAAAMLAIGGGAVLATLWLRNEHDDKSAAPPTQGQDPAPAPTLDAATAARVTTLLKQLELKDQRTEAIYQLAEIGPVASPLLRQALKAPAAVGEMKQTLEVALLRLPLRGTARAFALPPVPTTLIADYSENRLKLVDGAGSEIHYVDDVFGAWDAEFTPNSTLLITAFSISKVSEIDAKGNEVWSYEDLRNPYDADRLPNGNTLIADTFGMRVIEVTPKKDIVWSYNNEIRPFDCDRLPNGNTLIADMLRDRVIEVDPAGKVVWQVTDMIDVHDADRLPNGNTLITLRGKGTVIEVDPDGKVVWVLTGLSSPSDADRLPNGNTLVAENAQVREFDADKKVVWRKKATWAVEAARY